MKNYLVGTGIVVFAIAAESPEDAIATLKTRIDARRHEFVQNPEIGMSLVVALDEHRLNFVVMDEARTSLLGGELNWIEDGVRKSRYEQVVTRRLANTLPAVMTEYLYYQTDHTTA
jgi:hypothetical protein